MSFDWVPGVGAALLGTGLSMWRTQGVIEERIKGAHALTDERINALKSNEAALTSDLKAAALELRTAALDIRGLAVGQEVVNAISTKTLQGIATTLERHTAQIAEHGAHIESMRDWMSKRP